MLDMFLLILVNHSVSYVYFLDEVWILFLFLGWSYGSLDKMGMQILFYVTLGGLGVWALIRLFTLNGAIKAYNRKIAEQIGLESHELEILNLV